MAAELNDRPRKTLNYLSPSQKISAVLQCRLSLQIAPNQVWTTGITYIWTLEGWPYLAVVIDLFSRQVVGWAVADHMKASLCVSALQMAFLPTGHKGAENQNQVCPTTRTGVANMPAMTTENMCRP